MINQDFLRGVNVELDMPSQVEFNRKKNVEQDNKIQNLTSQVNILLEQAPAGFLPRVYYGLTNGAQVYRFTANAELSITGITGNEGDAFEFYLSNEIIADYIPAFAIKESNDVFKIINQGDYPEITTVFKIVNMRTGEAFVKTIENALTLQNASFLGDLNANENKEKQITVLNDLASGNKNVVFASINLNNDDVYNWISIGAYTNGRDGYSVYAVKTRDNLISVLEIAKINDIIVFGEDVTYNTFSAVNGDIFVIDAISPFSATNKGNIRGTQGLKGDKGEKGDAGTDGITPTIVDGNWFIGSTDTGVKAQGTDGTNGLNGQSFQIQSGLYSTPANVGKPENTTPEGESLKTLPTLPAQDLTGKGFIVFDPLTTPLAPFYDLYWANNGDVEWTIIHPFNGQNGKNGTNGKTPYIQEGYWYIDGVNTGTLAQGPKGDTGPAGTVTHDEINFSNFNSMWNWIKTNYQKINYIYISSDINIESTGNYKYINISKSNVDTNNYTDYTKTIRLNQSTVYNLSRLYVSQTLNSLTFSSSYSNVKTDINIAWNGITLDVFDNDITINTVSGNYLNYSIYHSNNIDYSNLDFTKLKFVYTS